MIQDFWLVDFVGMFFARAIVAWILFIHALVLRKTRKALGFFHLFSSVMIFLGAYSSFISLVWIGILLYKIVGDKIKHRRGIFENREYLYLLAFFFFLLFVGPGELSIDRIFSIRF